MKFITHPLLEKYSPYHSLDSAKLLCIENEALEGIINPKNPFISLTSNSKNESLENILKIVFARNKLSINIFSNLWQLFPEVWWVDLSYNSLSSLPSSSFPFVLGSLDLRGNSLTLSHLKNLSSVHILKLFIDIKRPEMMTLELLRTASSFPNIFVLNNHFISCHEKQLILNGQIPQYSIPDPIEENNGSEGIIFDDNSTFELSPRSYLDISTNNEWKTTDGWQTRQATDRQASFLTAIHSIQNPNASNDFLKLEILLEDYLHEAFFHNHHQELLEKGRRINPKSNKSVGLTQNSTNFVINSLEKMPTITDIEIFLNLSHSVRLDLSVILTFLIIFPLTIPKITCISLLEHLLLPHNISRSDIVNIYELPSYIKTSIVSLLRRISRKEYEEWIEGGSGSNVKMSKKPSRNIEEIVKSSLVNTIKVHQKQKGFSNKSNKKKENFFLKVNDKGNKEDEDEIYTYEGLIENFPTPTFEGSEGFLFLRSIKEYLQIKDATVEDNYQNEKYSIVPILPFSEIELEIFSSLPDCPTIWMVNQDLVDRLNESLKNGTENIDNGIGVGDASIFNLNLNSVSNWVSFSARHISLLINKLNLSPSFLRMPNNLQDMNKYLDLFGLLYIGGMSFIDLDVKNTGSLINGRSDSELLKMTKPANSIKNFNETNKKMLDKMLNNNVNEFKILNISSSRRVFRLQAMKKLLTYNILPFGVGLPNSKLEDLVWNIQEEEEVKQEETKTSIEIDTDVVHTFKNIEVDQKDSNFFLTGNDFQDSYVSPISNQTNRNLSPNSNFNKNINNLESHSFYSSFTEPTEFLNKFESSVKNLNLSPIPPKKNNSPSSPISPINFPDENNLNLDSLMSEDTDNVKFLTSENTLNTFSTNINRLKPQVEDFMSKNIPKGYSSLWNTSESNILNYQDYIQNNSSVLMKVEKEILINSLSTEINVLNQFPLEFHTDKQNYERKVTSPQKINQNINEKLNEFHSSFIQKHQIAVSHSDVYSNGNIPTLSLNLPSSQVKSSQIQIFSNRDNKLNAKDNFILAPSSSIKLFNQHVDSIKAQETALNVKSFTDKKKWKGVNEIPIVYIKSNEGGKILNNNLKESDDLNEFSQEKRQISNPSTPNNRFNSKRLTERLMELSESINSIDDHAEQTNKSITKFSDLLTEIKKTHFMKKENSPKKEIKKELIFDDDNETNDSNQLCETEIEQEYQDGEIDAIEEIIDYVDPKEIEKAQLNGNNHELSYNEKQELRIMTNILYEMGTLRNLRELKELNYTIKNSHYDNKTRKMIRPTKKLSILKPLRDILGKKVFSIVDQSSLNQSTSQPKEVQTKQSTSSSPSFFVTTLDSEETDIVMDPSSQSEKIDHSISSKPIYSNNIGVIDKSVKSSGTILYPLIQTKNLLKVTINDEIPPFQKSPLSPEHLTVSNSINNISPHKNLSSPNLFENSLLSRAPTYVNISDSIINSNSKNNKMKKNKVKNNLLLLRNNSTIFNNSLKKAIDSSDKMNDYENLDNNFFNSSEFSSASLDSEYNSQNNDINTIYTPISTKLVANIDKNLNGLEPPSLTNLSLSTSSASINECFEEQNPITYRSENTNTIRVSITKSAGTPFSTNLNSSNPQNVSQETKSQVSTNPSTNTLKLAISSSTPTLKTVNLHDPTVKVKPHRRLVSLSGEKEKGVWVGLDNYKKSTNKVKPNPNFKVTIPRHLQEQKNNQE